MSFHEKGALFPFRHKILARHSSRAKCKNLALKPFLYCQENHCRQQDADRVFTSRLGGGQVHRRCFRLSGPFLFLFLFPLIIEIENDQFSIESRQVVSLLFGRGHDFVIVALSSHDAVP